MLMAFIYRRRTRRGSIDTISGRFRSAAQVIPLDAGGVFLTFLPLTLRQIDLWFVEIGHQVIAQTDIEADNFQGLG
jgi:hypothetical protein